MNFRVFLVLGYHEFSQEKLKIIKPEILKIWGYFSETHKKEVAEKRKLTKKYFNEISIIAGRF
jgi:hypothetical protein